MKFFSLFRSQIPGIINKLKAIQFDLLETRQNFDQLVIMEKKLTAKEIAVEEHVEILEKAINTFGIPMWIKDLTGCFLHVNEACCEIILKCTADEALNFKNGDFKKDALSQVCMQSDSKVLTKKKTFRFIEHAVYEGNKHVWLDVTKSPVYNNQGNVVGTIGSAVVITDSVPSAIKELHTNSSSIEIPRYISIGQTNFVELLERRECVR